MKKQSKPDASREKLKELERRIRELEENYETNL